VTAVVVVLVVLLAVGWAYRDQLVRRVTRRKGGPERTWAWAPVGPTNPAAPVRHRLALVGDVGDGGRHLRATAGAIARVDRAGPPLDALVLLGDNVYPAGDPSRLRSTVFEPFAPVLAHAELLAVIGNHDVKRGHGAGQVAALGMPGRWWSRSLGDLLVVGLDSNAPDDPAQRDWLEATLAAATEPWRVVVLHHPPFSAGYQGSDPAVRRAFVPVLARHGVQLVVAGHDHDYQRSVPIDGVTYLVTGAAAAKRRTGEAPFTAVSFAWRHFVELVVSADRLVVRAVGPDLTVADEAVIPGPGDGPGLGPGPRPGR
jgi:3',5'-cyclic AMP phosphodiesterase CpdA